MEIKSYRDLDVWRRAIELVAAIYRLTQDFPAEEKFGLVSQMRRAAVSIPSNIAEGYARRERREYARFVSIAFGSGAELETQVYIAKQLRFAPEVSFEMVDDLLRDVQKMLNSLVLALRQPKSLIPSP